MQLPASCVFKRKLGHAAAEWHITEVHASQRCNATTHTHKKQNKKMFLLLASPTQLYCCSVTDPVFMRWTIYICFRSSSRILFKDKERKWEEIEGKLQAEHDSLLLKSSNKVTACRVSHCVISILAIKEAKVHSITMENATTSAFGLA